MQLVPDQFPPPPPEPARTWNAYDEMVKWEAETGYTGDNLYLDWVKSWLLPEQEEAEQSDIPPAPPAPPPEEGAQDDASLRPDDALSRRSSRTSDGGPPREIRPAMRLKNLALAKKPQRAETPSGNSEAEREGGKDDVAAS